ncbi:MAG: hypothetical protein JXR95_03215 [Deltaproteobacteria bacterium]|nr:hypothetical protein [Deltaproteobacteria bacterium]
MRNYIFITILILSGGVITSFSCFTPYWFSIPADLNPHDGKIIRTRGWLGLNSQISCNHPERARYRCSNYGTSLDKSYGIRVFAHRTALLFTVLTFILFFRLLLLLSVFQTKKLPFKLPRIFSGITSLVGIWTFLFVTLAINYTLWSARGSENITLSGTGYTLFTAGLVLIIIGSGLLWKSPDDIVRYPSEENKIN